MSDTDRLLEIEKRDDIGIVRFLDRIEMYQAAQIRADIIEWINEHRPQGLVFSFADVPYIDSSGVGVFVNLQYRIGDRIPMRLCQMSDTVRDVLTFTNLVSAFTIDNTEKESFEAVLKEIRGKS